MPRVGLFAWILACGGDDADGTEVPTDAPTDTETDADADTDSDSDSDTDADVDTHTGPHSSAWPGPGVRGSLTFRSSLSGNPLLGVVCEAEGATYASNAAGVARMVLSEDAEVAVACGNGVHMDLVQWLRTGATSGWNVDLELVTEGELVNLATVLQIGVPQATKGVVAVTVLDPAHAPLVGARVAIGSPSSGSMVSDKSTPLGHAAGDTIPAQSDGFVLFANVEPGPTTITVTPPAGETCATYPGEQAVTGVDVAASTIASVLFVCD